LHVILKVDGAGDSKDQFGGVLIFDRLALCFFFFWLVLALLALYSLMWWGCLFSCCYRGGVKEFDVPLPPLSPSSLVSSYTKPVYAACSN
jgi:hypothetical protein